MFSGTELVDINPTTVSKSDTLPMRIATMASAILAISKAVEGVARTPGASGKIMTVMLIGLAMIESLAIYVLVVALLIFFGVGPIFEAVAKIAA